MSIRTITRNALYRTAPGLVRRIKQMRHSGNSHETAEWWNDELAGRMSRPNINGQVSNALRDQTAAVLISLCGPEPRRVADFGCGFGEILPPLIERGCTEYVGIDLSDWVIEQGNQETAPRYAPTCRARFECADLREFSPKDDEEFDVIVFNEVLKYVEIEEAVAQLERLSKWLAKDGVICVNISGDVKSQAIFRALEDHFEWIYGTVYQQRPDRAVYRLTKSSATPPFLVGLFRPRGAA